MIRILLTSSFVLALSTHAFAQQMQTDEEEFATSTVQEVTYEYSSAPNTGSVPPGLTGLPHLTPNIPDSNSFPTNNSNCGDGSGDTYGCGGGVLSGLEGIGGLAGLGGLGNLGNLGGVGGMLQNIQLSDLVDLGSRLWQFVVNNKPNATYQILKTSVVPSGITDWTQLIGWKPPVSKIFRVDFKNSLGNNSGGFDYRVTYIPGGNYQGKGKFIGEISVVPLNIRMKTGRSVDFKADLSTPINYGTQTDPLAAAQLMVSWSTPTLMRYTMNSAEYFIYGDGRLQDVSSGTP